jgi:hypothetical protein
VSLSSYFEKGLAEKGKSEFQSTFNAYPKHYTPVFGELCPYSLAEGRHVAIDPTRFRIVGDQLLLFHRSKEKYALAEWDKSSD